MALKITGKEITSGKKGMIKEFRAPSCAWLTLAKVHAFKFMSFRIKSFISHVIFRTYIGRPSQVANPYDKQMLTRFRENHGFIKIELFRTKKVLKFISLVSSPSK